MEKGEAERVARPLMIGVSSSRSPQSAEKPRSEEVVRQRPDPGGAEVEAELQGWLAARGRGSQAEVWRQRAEVPI
jgi:hypothetical protein